MSLPFYENWIDLFREMGMQVIGAGRNAEEARRPAIIEKNGIKVAILGYSSVIRDGQAASPDKPGIAPLRAINNYDPIDFQPFLQREVWKERKRNTFMNAKEKSETPLSSLNSSKTSSRSTILLMLKILSTRKTLKVSRNSPRKPKTA
jgi:hypothetical protein